MKDNVKYKNLPESLAVHIKALEKIAEAVCDQDISNYPIFIVNESALAVGIDVISFEWEEKTFIISVSTLEELATKKVIRMEKVNDFIELYKKNKDSLCLLMPEKEGDSGGAFIFLPK